MVYMSVCEGVYLCVFMSVCERVRLCVHLVMDLSLILHVFLSRCAYMCASQSLGGWASHAYAIWHRYVRTDVQCMTLALEGL